MEQDKKVQLPPSPFPRGVNFTSVPNPLLAGLLEQITDIRELKVTLRVIWALGRKKSSLPFVTASELCSDRSVSAMLGATGNELEGAVRDALSLAVQRGTLLEVWPEDNEPQYLLNTQPVRAALRKTGVKVFQPAGPECGPHAETQQAERRDDLHDGVFRVYEENIGVMSPLIAESITTALQEHPESDVIDAIRVAVEANARSWKYVTAVLKRWAVEGRDARDGRDSNGKPERHSEADRSDEFIERYLERKRARGSR